MQKVSPLGDLRLIEFTYESKVHHRLGVLPQQALGIVLDHVQTLPRAESRADDAANQEDGRFLLHKFPRPFSLVLETKVPRSVVFKV